MFLLFIALFVVCIIVMMKLQIRNPVLKFLLMLGTLILFIAICVFCFRIGVEMGQWSEKNNTTMALRQIILESNELVDNPQINDERKTVLTNTVDAIVEIINRKQRVDVAFEKLKNSLLDEK